MTGRVLAPFFVLWVLIMSPTFCVAGVLEHACADCSVEDACGHEENCLDDPCLEVIARTSSPGTDGFSSLSPVALFRVSVLLDDRQVSEWRFCSIGSTLRNVPRPPSDLPLLI